MGRTKSVMAGARGLLSFLTANFAKSRVPTYNLA